MELINQLAYEIVEGQITLDDVIDGLTEQELNQLKDVIKIYQSTKIAAKLWIARKVSNDLTSQRQKLVNRSFDLDSRINRLTTLDSFMRDLAFGSDDYFKQIFNELQSNYNLRSNPNPANVVASTENPKKRIIGAMAEIQTLTPVQYNVYRDYVETRVNTINTESKLFEVEKQIGTLQTVFIISFIGDALTEIANALNPNI